MTPPTSPSMTTDNDMEGDSKQHPTVEDDIKLTDLEVATLHLLMKCDESGARRGFFDELLTFLHRIVKKGVDITKAKGRKTFIKAMEKKVKTPKPKSKKVGNCDVIYFPFLPSL